ncbi:YciI family protein [Jidongwangia harbinensis]|uniref:YciI family protein n=1 Tax=Jidongwangia harbinensis TaxID=2878561 RepID=UPI001CD97F95|nr:YciI family protein [Jidongwangia harbinensis]MCA2212602.1 YciI family protein [Jidongwangia harbinensis]
MKTYLLAIQQPVGAAPEPETLGPIMQKLAAIGKDLTDAGALVFTGGLHQPDASTVLRPHGPDVLVTDGPYTEGKEFVGGLWVLRLEDLDAALAYGRRIVEATGLPIEVRPFAG